MVCREFDCLIYLILLIVIWTVFLVVFFLGQLFSYQLFHLFVWLDCGVVQGECRLGYIVIQLSGREKGLVFNVKMRN